MPREFFGAGLLQRLAEDLCLHGLAAEQALQLADLRLELADPAGRDHVVVRPDSLEATFGHAPPPSEQQAGRDAMEPGNGRNRHAGPCRLFDQPDLLLGSVSPPALPAGDDLDALDRFRHRRTPRLEPRPSGLRRVSGRNGVRSNLRPRVVSSPPCRAPQCARISRTDTAFRTVRQITVFNEQKCMLD